jgi:hypothetical protein
MFSNASLLDRYLLTMISFFYYNSWSDNSKIGKIYLNKIEKFITTQISLTFV